MKSAVDRHLSGQTDWPPSTVSNTLRYLCLPKRVTAGQIVVGRHLLPPGDLPVAGDLIYLLRVRGGAAREAAAKGQKTMNNVILLNDNTPETLGMLPSFINPDDKRPAAKQGQINELAYSCC